jgi:hypothetical protein
VSFGVKALSGLQLEMDQSHTGVMQITHPREGNAPDSGSARSFQS